MPTTLGLLRVRGAGEDTPALRLGLTSLLATGDFEPAGLPPAAILVVRRVADPIPGRMPATRRRVALDAAWERAVRDALADQLRRALRPMLGDVDSADAILFADEAEMLACFMMDASRGHAAHRWWWRHLRLHATDNGSDAIERALIAHAVHVPGAFACLDRVGTIGEVVNSIAPDACWRVLEAAATACGLPSITTHVKRMLASAIARDSAPQAGHARATPRRSETLLPVPGAHGKGDSLGTPATPAGDVAHGEEVAIPTPERRVLCALLIAMGRAPARLRTTSFLDSVVERAATGIASPLVQPGQSNSSQHRVAAAQTVDTAPAANTSVAPDHRHDLSHQLAQDDNGATTAPIQVDRTSRDAPQVRRVQRDDGRVNLPEAADVWSMDAGVHTSLAGVLYLVNVMRDLGLPECFEVDWRLATGAGTWDTLTGIAAGLLGDAFEEWRGDPIWSTLAVLNGRRVDQPIGLGCIDAGGFAAPLAWQSFAADIPRDGASGALPTVPMLTSSVAFARWLRHALPPIRRRIAAAFGLPGSRTQEVSRLLLHHEGRVYVTSSHVDVVLPLDRVSLPVRRAGLDRTPGWMPSFARVIAFHFE